MIILISLFTISAKEEEDKIWKDIGNDDLDNSIEDKKSRLIEEKDKIEYEPD